MAVAVGFAAHTISHYLQTSVMSWNRTLYIECCSEISINLLFRSQCYFASIFYSTAYVFRIISFCFLSCILFYVACAFVICLIKYLLTYLLTYFPPPRVASQSVPRRRRNEAPLGRWARRLRGGVSGGGDCSCRGGHPPPPTALVDQGKMKPRELRRHPLC